MIASLASVLPEIGPGAILATLAIFFCGGLVKGGAGFGLPLITISVLPLVVPIEMALAINAIILPLTNVIQYVQAGQMGHTIVRFWPMLAGLTLGIPIGAMLVSAIDQRFLTLSLGVFIMVFVPMTAFNPRFFIPREKEKPIAGLTGILAGIIGALTTANGPVFVSYLVGARAERRLMLSALGLFFLFSGTLITGSFWFIGFLNLPRFILALLCFPVALIGMKAGNAVAERLSASVFRTAILVMLFGLGLNMVVKTLITA